MNVTFDEGVRMVAGMRYTLEHGALAENGCHIRYDDPRRHRIKAEYLEQAQYDVRTCNQHTVYGGVLWQGNVTNTSHYDGLMVGYMRVLDGELILMVISSDDNRRWHVSSARMRYDLIEAL